MKSKIAVILMTCLFTPALSSAYEMVGMLSYNLGQVTPRPLNYQSNSDGIGYVFLARVDLGPGQIESGFQFTPTSIKTKQATFDVTARGSYWILPLMYRYTFLPPFFSVGVGIDYAVVGTNNITTTGNTSVNGITSGYNSHFGAQVSLAASQDLGEDMSLVLDLRYRQGLADAISYSFAGSKYNFAIIALGIQKHLE